MLGLAILALIAPSQQTAHPFEGDARLEKLISYRADVEPVATVCKAISEQIGVPLEVRPSLQEDLVIICFKERPAKEVLSVIASHFGWEWTKEGESYRLIQTASSQQEEKRLLEEAIVKPYLEEQERFRKQLKETQGIDPVEANKRIEKLNEELARLILSEREEDEERVRALYKEITRLEAAADPFRIFTLVVIGSLSRERFLELDRRSRLVFSYRPTAAQLPLPGPAVGAAEQLVRELVKKQAEHDARAARAASEANPPAGGGEEGEEVPATPAGVLRKFSADEVATVRITITGMDMPLWKWAAGRISADVDVISKTGEIVARGGEAPWEIGRALLEPESLGGGQESEKPGDDKAGRLPEGLPEALMKPVETEGLKAAARAFGSWEWGSFAGMGDFLKKGSTVDLLAFEWRIYNEVADATGVPIIADAYDSMDSDGRLEHGGRTGAEILSRITHGYAKWKYEDGWVKVRSEEWALGRAVTVPRSILRPIRDVYVEQGGLTLEQMAAMCSKLTDKQLANPFVFHGLLGSVTLWTAPGGPGLKTAYGLRAFHALSPTEKLTLLNGGSLQYAMISPLARVPLQEFLYRTGSQAPLNSESTFALLDDDIMSLLYPAAEQGLSEDEPADELKDREITQILPFGPGPDASFRLKVQQTEGLAIHWKQGDAELPMTMPVGMYALIQAFGSESIEAGGVGMSGFRPGVVTAYSFSLEYAPNESRGFAVMASLAVPGSQPGEYDSLPQALRDKVAKAAAKMKERAGGLLDPSPPPPPPPPCR